MPRKPPPPRKPKEAKPLQPLTYAINRVEHVLDEIEPRRLHDGQLVAAALLLVVDELSKLRALSEEGARMSIAIVEKLQTFKGILVLDPHGRMQKPEGT
jgi:hypothetical protein